MILLPHPCRRSFLEPREALVAGISDWPCAAQWTRPPPPRGEPGAAGQELVQVERRPWSHPELALAGVSHTARWVSRSSLFYFGRSVFTISLYFISDLVMLRVPSTFYP